MFGKTLPLPWLVVKASVFCNVSARSRHFVYVDVIFLPSVCDSFCVSTFSLVANCMNNPRSCSAGVDEMRVLQLFVFFVPTMFSGIFGSFGKNSTVLSPFFGLHANIVEEYVLLSALLHDQSCLQSSSCFQHQLVWLPFYRTLVCNCGCSFHVHGSTRVVSSSLCYVAVSRARENNWDKPLHDVIIIDCLCHYH